MAVSANTIYNSIRLEVTEHVNSRERVMLTFLLFSAAMFGIDFAKSVEGTLMVIPFLAIGAAVLIVNNDVNIAAICRYCRLELPVEDNLKDWDGSVSLGMVSDSLSNIRFLSYLILLVFPSVWATHSAIHLEPEKNGAIY